MPDVTVVVPARNSASTIAGTLAALGRQDFDGSFEIVVVTTEDAAAMARAAGARVVLRSARLSAADARNAGAAAARAPVLAFTDADCEPAPDWLARGVAALAGADVVQGAVRPTPGVRVGPYDRTLHVTRETGLWESANLFVRRSAFEALGGFPSFVAGGRADDGTPLRGSVPRVQDAPLGEDTWFGWRARRAGLRAVFAADVLVHHLVLPRTWRGYVRERWRGRHFPALVAVVPEFRAHLFLRCFLTRRSAAFDLAVVAVVGAALSRRPALLAGAVPYAWMAAPRSRHWALWALKEVPADAARSASLAYGSLRAGTPVL